MTRGAHCRKAQILNLLDYPRMTVCHFGSESMTVAVLYLLHNALRNETNRFLVLVFMKYLLSRGKSFPIFH